MGKRLACVLIAATACGPAPAGDGRGVDDGLESDDERDAGDTAGAAADDGPGGDADGHRAGDGGGDLSSGDAVEGDPSGDDSGGGDTDAIYTGPVRYPGGPILSPISASVIARMAAIRSLRPSRYEDVFIKIGASSTAGPYWLECFDGRQELGEHTHLADAIDYFSRRAFGDETSFTRDSLAALSGVTAGWAISGDPSPAQQEVDALNPVLAFINYGTNDMGMGSTYANALWAYSENYWDLADLLVDQGVVPVVTASIHSGDPTRDPWVQTYNLIARGIAQVHQVPFIDLYAATDGLDGYGLSSDGIHANHHPDGACLLTAEGLAYGFNVRNLVSLQTLDAMRPVLTGAAAPEVGEPVLAGGAGSLETPFVIPALPFTHVDDTTRSPHDAIDAYACAPDTNESGPEWFYELTVNEPTALRIVVINRDAVDTDIHLLDGATCRARAHRLLQGTLAPGTYTLVMDTWVNDAGDELGGEYMLGILECHPDDPSCADPL